MHRVESFQKFDTNFTEGDQIIKENDQIQQNQSQVRAKNICRICFYAENQGEDENNLLLAPCDCKGSLQFVHQRCIRVWVRRKLKKNKKKLKENQIQCQVCMGDIKFRIQIQEKCMKLSALKQNIINSPISYLIALVLLLIFSGFPIFMMVLLPRNTEENQIFLIGMTIISLFCLIIYLPLMLKIFSSKR